MAQLHPSLGVVLAEGRSCLTQDYVPFLESACTLLLVDVEDTKNHPLALIRDFFEGLS